MKDLVSQVLAFDYLGALAVSIAFPLLFVPQLGLVRTGVLFVTATGRDIDSYQWEPARIKGGVATPLPAGSEADAELAHWNELRGCTGLAP